MARPASKTSEPFTFVVKTAREAAEIVGRNSDTVCIWAREGSFERRDRKGSRYYEYDVVSLVRHDAKMRAREQRDEEVKALRAEIRRLREQLSGSTAMEPDSELEKLKIQKAQIEIKHKQYDMLERRRELIPRAHVTGYLDLCASHYRRAGDLLRKHHGDDAQKILHDAIDAVAKGIGKLWDDIEESADRRTKKGRLIHEDDESTPSGETGA